MSDSFHSLEPSAAQAVSLSANGRVKSFHSTSHPGQVAEAWLQDEAAGVSLSRFFQIVRKYRTKILCFVAFSMGAAALVTSQLKPLYESTTKVKVEHRATGGLIGHEASVPTSAYDMDQLISTQTQLILSDPVLRPVADHYHLLDRENQFAGLTPAEITKTRNQAIVLKHLKVLRIPNTYIIAITFRDHDAEIAAKVANAIADSYLAHAFDSKDRSLDGVSIAINRQLGDLRAKMDNSGQALTSFERQLNLVDPAQRVSMLSARLLQLNTDYTAAQTERLRKEAALATIKSGARAGSTADDGTLLAATESKLDDAKQQFAKVRSIYGEGHSEYTKAESQVRELETQLQDARARANVKAEADYQEALSRENMAQALVAQTKHEVDALNSRTYEYEQLKGDAEADKKLWDDLTRLTREAEINRTFENAIVQIAERALPAAKKAFPSMPINLAVAFLLAGILGITGAILADSVSTRLSDPEEAARKLNIDVLGSLPAAKDPIVLVAERKWANTGSERHRERRKNISISHEATCALRNVINIVNANDSVGSLLVTSSEAGAGKTTVAANLAFAYALMGKKTLLIDANLRSPSLHALFNIGGTSGLAQVLSHDTEWKETVVKVTREPFYIMPAGITSKRSADIIGFGIKDLISEARKEYDLVIVDGPEILNAPESLALATSVEGVVFVARAGVSSSKTAAHSLSSLAHSRANTIGIVMNNVKSGQNLAPYFSVQRRLTLAASN